MKLIVLLFIFLIFFLIINYFKKKKDRFQRNKVNDDKTIDLEIDPKTKEYRPKE